MFVALGLIMGLGPPEIELYRQLKLQGALGRHHRGHGIRLTGLLVPAEEPRDRRCAKHLVATRLIRSCSIDQCKPQPAQAAVRSARHQGMAASTRRQGRILVMDSITMAVPAAHKQIGLVTNIGTSEHILTGTMCSRRCTSLRASAACRACGAVHRAPGTWFFNYQPNFFEALGATITTPPIRCLRQRRRSQLRLTRKCFRMISSVKCATKISVHIHHNPKTIRKTKN